MHVDLKNRVKGFLKNKNKIIVVIWWWIPQAFGASFLCSVHFYGGGRGDGGLHCNLQIFYKSGRWVVSMLFRVWLSSIFVGTGHYHWRFLLPTLNGLPVTAKKTMTSIHHPHGSTVLAGFFFFCFFHYFRTILFEGQQSNTKNSRFGNRFLPRSFGWRDELKNAEQIERWIKLKLVKAAMLLC